jgi:ribosomal protein S18 acetylase RimI-like enzyme
MKKIEEAISPYPGITLWVLKQNQAALAFYRRIGYESDGAEKTVEIGGAKLLEIRLRRR